MIQIDYRSPKAIYEQVRDEFKKLIMKGVLKEHEQIPSVRELAGELSINPNTIQRAYHELENEGFLYSIKGRGNFISPKKAAENTRRLEELLEEFAATSAELIYLGMSPEELIAKLKKGGKNHDSN